MIFHAASRCIQPVPHLIFNNQSSTLFLFFKPNRFAVVTTAPGHQLRFRLVAVSPRSLSWRCSNDQQHDFKRSPCLMSLSASVAATATIILFLAPFNGTTLCGLPVLHAFNHSGSFLPEQLRRFTQQCSKTPRLCAGSLSATISVSVAHNPGMWVMARNSHSIWL